MAVPNLSEIVTTTIENRSKVVADNVSASHALLDRLEKKGKAKPASGGRNIVQELEFAENGTFGWYSGYDSLNIAPSEVFSAAEYDWKQAAVAVSISGLEELMNSSEEAFIDLLENRLGNAERTMKNQMGAAVYGDGTASGGKAIGGLQLLVADAPATGTVGNINRANWSFWRNIAADAAIRGGYWKLVQIDSDMFWNVTQLLRIVGLPVEIVAGAYIRKQPKAIKWLIVKTPGAEIGPEGLLQCDFVGTGMLSTEVDGALKRMVEFYPERRFLSDEGDGKETEMTELFPIGLVGPNTPEGRIARIKQVLISGLAREPLVDAINEIVNSSDPTKARFLGEDYHFCHLARKAGLKIWCDTTQLIGHVGEVVYPIAAEMVSTPSPIPTHGLDLSRW